jgi:hypothetical protein
VQKQEDGFAKARKTLERPQVISANQVQSITGRYTATTRQIQKENITHQEETNSAMQIQ